MLLKIIVLDNESYESTGGQPTNSTSVDFEKLALANKYKFAKTVKTKEELLAEARDLNSQQGPYMLIVKVNNNSRKNLGRPTTTPVENKQSFMDFLRM